ncbi:MAG TPA: GTPase HflX [Lentisphaeria bacterium]|nr:MAG: GTPase HflX [Lentisphaerae bacterium GWF2_49_21]HBC88131.1 GTPase HflX [Lentisphaeria bacterium]
MFETKNRNFLERAILIGFHDFLVTPADASEHLSELQELMRTLGIPVIKEITVNLRNPNPKFLMGSGKAEEIANIAKDLKADSIVFDHDLSPSQQRNWEKFTKLCVIDRQEVIIDIFASRALTREAAIQVELARMQYSLPRLTRAWTHFSRQTGGKFVKGAGEQQIEIDRRMIKHKISQLQKELKDVKQQRLTQRKMREKTATPNAAIVGYTNAGKSSLLNKLTGAHVLVEDKLFATLDPTTRHFTLPNNQNILLTDTVGFVRKLPHTLVDAFKSTLEEAVLADFIIHVLDISSKYVDEHWKTTLAVLEELGAGEKDIITVFNKSDIADDPVLRAKLKALEPEGIFISAKTGLGMDRLVSEITHRTRSTTEIVKMRIPPARHDLIAAAHKNGKVLDSKYDDDGTAELAVSISKSAKRLFEDFICD